MEIEHHLFCILNLFSFNLYPKVGREDAQTEFGIVDLLCIICREVLKACVDRLPTLILVPTYSTKRNKMKTNKGSSSWNTGEPKFINYYYHYYLYLFILLLFFPCSPNFILKHNSSKSKLKFYSLGSSP